MCDFWTYSINLGVLIRQDGRTPVNLGVLIRQDDFKRLFIYCHNVLIMLYANGLFIHTVHKYKLHFIQKHT